jgi:hypothetical protein
MYTVVKDDAIPELPRRQSQPTLVTINEQDFRRKIAAEPLLVRTYVHHDRSAVRRVLERIGWAEHYIAAFESAAETFSAAPGAYGVDAGGVNRNG